MKGRIGSLQIKFVQIPREENECADRLAKATAAECMLVPNQVLSFVQTSSLIDSETNVQKVDSESNWTMPLTSYLKNGMLPDGKDATRKLEGPSLTIRPYKGCLIQKRLLPPLFEMLSPRGSGIRHERSSPRDLWQRKGTYHLETLDEQKLPHP